MSKASKFFGAPVVQSEDKDKSTKVRFLRSFLLSRSNRFAIGGCVVVLI